MGLARRSAALALLGGLGPLLALAAVLAEDTEYTQADNPVRVSSSLGVPSGVTLTLKPGVQVVCLVAACIQVIGHLVVQGSLSDPVTFSCEGEGCAYTSVWITILTSAGADSLSVSHAVFNGGSPPCLQDHVWPVTAISAEYSGTADSMCTATLAFETVFITDVTARCVQFITAGDTNSVGCGDGSRGLQFTRGDFQHVRVETQYPRPARMEFFDSNFQESLVQVSSYAKRGMHLTDCSLSATTIDIGCCGNQLRIDGSTLCSCLLKEHNNYWDVAINGSTLLDSRIELITGNSFQMTDTTVVWSGGDTALHLGGDHQGASINLDGVSILGSGTGVAVRVGGQASTQVSRTLVQRVGTAIHSSASDGDFVVASSNFIDVSDLLFENVGSTDVSVSSCFLDGATVADLPARTVDQMDTLTYGRVTYTEVQPSPSDEPPQAPPPPSGVTLSVGDNVLVEWEQAIGAEGYEISLWAPPSNGATCGVFGESILTGESEALQVSLPLPADSTGSSEWVCGVQAVGAGGRSWYTFAGSGFLPPSSSGSSSPSPSSSPGPTPSQAPTPSPSALSPSSPSPSHVLSPSPSSVPSPAPAPVPVPVPSAGGDPWEEPVINVAADDPAESSSGGWLVPLLSSVAGVLLVALLTVAVCWLRQRRRRPPGKNRPMETEDVSPVVVEAPVPAELQPPNNWSQSNRSGWTNGSSVALVEVDGMEALGLQELMDKTFKKVRTRDRKTGPMPERLKLLSVQRVENTDLWQKYAASRQVLKSKRAHKCTPVASRGGVVRTMENPLLAKIVMPIINEVYLWHGTSEDGAKSIVQGGFKVELAGSSAGTLYGKGVYLAECSSKADEYTGSDGAVPGARCLLLCRVVLGEVLSLTAGGEATYKMIEAGIESGAYDSVLGDREASVGTYREFVVYNAAHVYPDYLIRYEHELE